MFQTRACRKCGENFVAMSQAHSFCRRHRKQPQRPNRPDGCSCPLGGVLSARMTDGAGLPCQAAVWIKDEYRWQCGRARNGYRGPRRGRPSRCEVCQARDATLRWYPDAQQWACATHEGSPFSKPGDAHVIPSEAKTAEDAWAEYIEQNSTAAERAEAARLSSPDRARKLHWDLPVSQLVDCIEASEWTVWAAEQPLQDQEPASPASGYCAPINPLIGKPVQRDLDREGRYVGWYDEVHPIEVVQGDGSNGHRAGCMCRIVERQRRENAGVKDLQRGMTDLKLDAAEIVMLEPGEQIIPLKHCDCEYEEVVYDGAQFSRRERVLTRPCVMHSTHGNFQR